MNKAIKERVQGKVDLLHDLRERDNRALPEPEHMLESDLDKEIEYRESNRSFESTESVLSDIRNVLLRLEQYMNEKKAENETLEDLRNCGRGEEVLDSGDGSLEYNGKVFVADNNIGVRINRP